MSRRRRTWQSFWEYYPPRSQPRKVAGGIQARSRRGAFGSSWWASRWIAVLHSFGWSNRLQRGASYARRGQILDFQLKSGVVTARVQGSRPQPYKVRIAVQPLSHQEWEQVVDAMAAQAVFAAKLLAGEMPQDIEAAFAAARSSLFPQSAQDLETECSCPDFANPCKHIAAVYYILAEEFDRDPFMLFRLRGRTKEEIISALRQRRAAGAVQEREPAPAALTAETAQPLEADLSRFWAAGERLQDVRITIAPPAVPGAVLKRLGAPPFWKGREDLLALLAENYRLVSQQALALAYGEEEEKE
ncbi:MAG: SWIM zinc finger family protein [Deinococcus sp.]|nr:SWIM zinc finger family protein [Deinococcus sp.]